MSANLFLRRSALAIHTAVPVPVLFAILSAIGLAKAEGLATTEISFGSVTRENSVSKQPDGARTGAGVFPGQVGKAVSIEVANTRDVPSDGGCW
jgi:hypothetical protein